MDGIFDQLLKDIDHCIEQECFVAALSLALTVPDICGKAEYPSDSVRDRYIKWFNKFIEDYEKPNTKSAENMPYTSGELVYNLRNNMLHQGDPGVIKERIKEDRFKIDRFQLIIDSFMVGGGSMVSYGMNNEIRERTLEVNLVNLCQKICMVATTYYEDNLEKFNFFNYDIKDQRDEENNYDVGIEILFESYEG